MAIIKCPECGNEVSDLATKCIHCGAPLKKDKQWLAKNRKPLYIALIAILLCVSLSFLSIKVIIPNVKYNHAIKAFENKEYEDAFNQFLELEDYKDSQEWRDKSFKFYLYELGVELYEKGEYIAAKTAFEEVGNIADSQKYYNDIVLHHKDTMQLLRGKWMAKAGFQRHHDYSYYAFDPENLTFTLYWDNGQTKWTKTCNFIVSDDNTIILKNLKEFEDDFDTLSDIKCTLSPDGKYLTTPFKDKWGYNGYATFIKFED